MACVLIPAFFKILINSLDDPSKIGISSLSISIVTLSMPQIYSAASKCSTVETFLPNLFSRVVQRVAEDTFL